MADSLPDPAHEKEHLFAAIGSVYTHWGTAQMAQAYEALVQAVAHAEQTLSQFTPHYNTQTIAFRVHVLGLGCMIQYARDEVARVECFARALVEEAGPSPYLH